MRKVFYYWFVAMLEDAVMEKIRMAKYIQYKLEKMISANRVDIKFQYFLIYFT